MLVVILAGGGVGAYYALWDSPEVASNGATAVIKRGPLVVTVNENGEVEAEKRVTIANSLNWPVIIDEVVEDGVIVEANQVIVKFSCKELDDKVHSQELTVRSARSDFEQAEMNLKLKEQELTEKVRKAKQAVEDAKLDKKRYEEGEWPIKEREQVEDIKLQKRDLKIAEDDLQFKIDAGKELGDKSPYTQSEIRTDRLNLDRKTLGLEKAKTQLAMLREYDHPKELRRLDNAVRDSELALKRAEHDAVLEKRKATELVQERKERRDRHEKEMTRLLEEQGKLTVKAEKKGLVVYQAGRRRYDPGGDTQVEKGAKIEPRRQIMIIPDMTTLQIRTRVYEAVSPLVKKGLKASVWLETDPEKALTATVHKIKTLPEEAAWYNRDVKVFPVIVKLDEPVEGLKPKMTAKVELELCRLENVVLAPIAAVFHEQGESYCLVMDGDGRTKKALVEVGLVNDKEVQIVSGLKVGDKVLLAEPDASVEIEGTSEGPAGIPG